MKHKLAIFDLDGTLFDTQEVNYQAYKQALESNGYTLERDFYRTECNGRYYKDYLPLIMGDVTDAAMERIHRQKKENYAGYLGYAKMNIPLFDIIKGLKEEYYLAIVTTASRKNCEDILQFFTQDMQFDLILTNEDVKEKKPNPEGFLKAMEYFQTAAKDTVIFEDSEIGLEAAKRSGAAVMAVVKF